VAFSIGIAANVAAINSISFSVVRVDVNLLEKRNEIFERVHQV
jgi:hypothetical protein